MREYKQLSHHEQLELFHERGINFGYEFTKLDDANQEYQKNLRTISTLGYYQLKDYAYPYMENGKYKNVGFNDIVARYYRDKRLRNTVQHAIEDIEASLNTRIAHILGKICGSLGYLEFNQWCEKDKVNKYIGKKGKFADKYFIAKEQTKFLQKIQNKARKSASIDVLHFDKENKKQVYVPIWLMMNELTLGDSIHIVKLMKMSIKRKLANEFYCSVDELISWLECINLVRNICCHNGNLVDIRLKTSPKVPEEYRKFLTTTDEKSNVFTNKLSIVICIIIKLMMSINKKYRFGNMLNSILHLLDESNEAVNYGFESKQAILECFKDTNTGKNTEISPRLG